MYLAVCLAQLHDGGLTAPPPLPGPGLQPPPAPPAPPQPFQDEGVPPPAKTAAGLQVPGLQEQEDGLEDFLLAPGGQPAEQALASHQG